MNIEQLYTRFRESKGISTDTRNINQEQLFFALKGDNFNGNIYAEKAINSGAAYAIVDEALDHPQAILVDDVLKTLQELAKHHRKQLNIPLIGLTGSNGKTTTKELINAVLATQFKTYATRGNLNNHIGVPLTLLEIDESIEIAIIEMGANHLKEIELLSSICIPDYGYITNFGKAHLEGFGSLEGVIEGKSELFKQLEKTNGKAFVFSDNQKQIDKSKSLDQIIINDSTEIVQTDPTLHLQWDDYRIKTHLAGIYNKTNIAAAIAIGEHFKITPANIVHALENYIPTNNRSQLIKKGGATILLDAYNANPTSTRAALESFLSSTTAGVIILGDMFELGKTAAIEHQAIADFLKSKKFKEAHLIGENYSRITTTENKISLHKNYEEFSEVFSSTTATYLIKGSRGMKLERILKSFD